MNRAHCIMLIAEPTNNNAEKVGYSPETSAENLYNCSAM